MKKMNRLLYIIAGILFVLAAIIGKNFVFIPIGVCFAVLGILGK